MKHINKNVSAWRKTGAIALCCGACATAQASLDLANISSLNTGATSISGVDQNWTVSANPAGPGNFTGPVNAFVVNDDGNFPFNGWWLHSTGSSWISYSSPLNIAGDLTGATYDYHLTFTPTTSGIVAIDFASDNPSTLLINGIQAGANPSAYAFENFDQINYLFVANTAYTIDFDVYNIPQNDSNPTGANVQFSLVTPVPETTTVVAGALLLLPLGASALRGFRKNHIA